MKTKNLIVALIVAIFIAFGCSGKKSYDNVSNDESKVIAEEQETIESSSVQENRISSSGTAKTQQASMKTDYEAGKDNYASIISSTTAEISKFDSVYKLVRTVEIKFRALNVTETSYAIEDIVKKFDGYISSTYLTSNITNKKTTRVSPDSIVETTTYHFTNDLIARVPAKNMDTVLKCIAPMIDFLDYRNIKAENVSLSYLRKQLEKKRLDLYNIQVNQLTTSGNSNERLLAMEMQLQKQIQNDEALIERLELDDKVAFATITLHIYGRDKAHHVILPDEERIDSYKPEFGKELKHAISKGWQALQSFIIELITIWPLWLMGALLWFIIVRIKKAKKSKQEQK